MTPLRPTWMLRLNFKLNRFISFRDIRKKGLFVCFCYNKKTHRQNITFEKKVTQANPQTNTGLCVNFSSIGPSVFEQFVKTSFYVFLRTNNGQIDRQTDFFLSCSRHPRTNADSVCVNFSSIGSLVFEQLKKLLFVCFYGQTYIKT